MTAHKTYNRQQKAGGIHDCDWSNPEAFLDVFVLTHDHQGFSLTKQGVRGDKGIQSASTLCSQDIDIEFFTDIQLTDGFSHPALRNRHLEDGILTVQLDVIQYMVGTVPDGRPPGKLFFRLDYLIGTVSQEELLLHIGCGAGHYHSCPQFLQ